MTATRIVTNFNSPVDACLMGNVMHTLKIRNPSINRTITLSPNTVSEKEISVKTSFTVNPNPTSHLFYLQPDRNTSTGNYLISILNALGQHVYQNKFYDEGNASIPVHAA
jgi:hypothetical protein